MVNYTITYVGLYKQNTEMQHCSLPIKHFQNFKIDEVFYKKELQEKGGNTQYEET